MKNEQLSKSALKKQIINNAIKEYLNTPLYDRSISRVSEKFGINKKTLSKYLKEKGVEIISNRNRCNFSESVFDTIDSEEKAYWLGFMYADGYVLAKKPKFGLSLSLKDINHLKKFNDFLKYPKGLNIKETHQFGSKEHVNKNGETLYMVTTEIQNQHTYDALVSKGVVPNKSLILTFPDINVFTSESLVYHFIRGYFDGDGTLGLYNHSKTNPNLEESLSFVGTKDFLKGVQKYLGEGYLMQKKNCNENTYRLGYSTKKAFNAAKLMYENATIYLDRKYNIYINQFASKNRGKTVKAETPTPC